MPLVECSGNTGHELEFIPEVPFQVSQASNTAFRFLVVFQTPKYRTIVLTTPMERNIKLYPWYTGFFHALFWVPVFFLYFSERVSLAQVLLLEGIYYAGVVGLEVPSGYFSDRMGRKRTLMISAIAFIVAYGLFYFGTGFLPLAMAQIGLAVGFAFHSGSDVSFHYDSLASLGRSAEFGDREARAAQIAQLAAAGSALGGGLVATFQLKWAYGLSAFAALGTLIIAMQFREPVESERAEPRFWNQIRFCLGYLKNGKLSWLLAFAVLMTILNHIPYEFIQPYLNLLFIESPLASDATPLAAGVTVAVTMTIGSFFAARSIQWQQTFGIGWVLLGAVVIQTAIILAMGFWLHGLVLVLVAFRNAPMALAKAPMNAAMAPLIKAGHRATYLSLQSLAGRLAFSLFLFFLSGIADAQHGNWAVLSVMLKLSGILGLAGLVILWGFRAASGGKTNPQ